MLRLIFILCLLPLLSFSQSTLTDSLIMHFTFSGNTLDVSGNGNHAINNGATLTADRFGKPNSAYLFDGIDDYMLTNKSFDIPERTLSVWVNPYDITGTNTTEKFAVVQDDNSLTYGAMLVKFGSNQLQMMAGGESAAFGTSAAANQWYHVVIVRNGATTQYYVDNVLVGNSSSGSVGSTFTPNKDIVIGAGRSTIYQFFDGVIDDIRLYSRALTTAEIDSLFNNIPTGIESVNLKNKYKVGPIPLSNQLHIYTSNDAEPTAFTVYNMKGEELLKVQTDPSLRKKDYVIEFSQLSPGLYILSIEDKQGSWIQKVSKSAADWN